ncbi:ABC-F family ATP-binding cassette domain-containing protein [Oceanivirga miroungae]|uniref:ABC transporter domain-containing protein n=1 Tax=Oceanivirga miroungae TaxID=1130046 RepID=A0A6I8MCP6_9FUSO|nr:ABC-F family ATP-binding cassette domain-containing protein [Oceanivirga miroungae]VWL84886.1 hypothetical protein OMES3154_00143 [Oceanivirga miroungae]
MDIVQFNNVNKSFLDKTILRNISFNISEKEKVGLVGLNGVGKSTLINILKGIERIDSGSVFVNNKKNIAYLDQEHSFSDENNTVYEEIKTVFSYEYSVLNRIQELNALIEIKKDESLYSELEKLNNAFLAVDGYNLETKINKVIMGLQLDSLKSSIISNLSGGEKTRLSLAKLLLTEKDLLILDEPTNHLDLASIEWLEGFLSKFNGAVLLISHDRVFLDNVCSSIMEIENKELIKYKGNFSDFIIQKEMIIKGKLKAFEKEQDRIKKLEEYIERNRAGRMAAQAKGREKILNRIDRLDDPIFNIKRMKLRFNPKYDSNENVLEVAHISKSFDNEKILNDISFKLYKGEKVGIIGKNGSGKSTLLKIIADKLKKDSGEIKLGNRVIMSYFSQNNESLNNNNNLIEEINTSINYIEEDLRRLLAAFLFSAEDIEKKISSLSGGEKVRISLIKMLQQEANFLILDEPTNHLDIYSIEILENALEEFSGSILLVSHNRHFIDSICNTIYVLDENGLTEFKGNYDEYKKSLEREKEDTKNSVGRDNYIKQKENLKKISKLKKSISDFENRVKKINEEKEKLNKLMFDSNNSHNLTRLNELQDKITKLDEEELTILEEWEKMSDELENINDEA